MADESREQELGRCTIVVTCVVLKRMPDGVRTLILKRAETEEEGPGLWTIPGGKLKLVDVGAIGGDLDKDLGTDVLTRGIVREIEEETGIVKNSVRPAFLLHHDKIFRRKDGTPTLVVVFWTEYWGSDMLKAGEGAIECRWASEAELDNYTFIGNVKADIKAVFQVFWNREDELRRPYVCDMDH